MREGGPKKGKREEPSRRDFIRLTASAAMLAGTMGAVGMFERSQREAREAAKQSVPDWTPKHAGESFLEYQKQPRSYDTSSIEGVQLGAGMNRYLGLPWKVKLDKNKKSHRYAEAGAAESLDFKYELAQMWKQKLALVRGDEPEEEFGEHDRGAGVAEAMQGIFASYAPPEPGEGESVDAFTTYVDHVIGDTASKLDLSRVESHFEMGDKQIAAFERLATAIDANLLLAYSMTELMPAHDGKENLRVYEFLLKNAGRGFLERIPALGDSLISFGPYQFTAAALKDDLDAKNKPRVHGASVIDGLQAQRLLPPNVVSLRNDDHYRAAYMFALYNFVVLVKKLGEQRSAELLQNYAGIDRAARDFVIAAHHRPKDAVHAFEQYLRLRRTQPGASVSRYCATDVATYLEKSHSNEQALHAKVAQR